MTTKKLLRRTLTATVLATALLGATVPAAAHADTGWGSSTVSPTDTGWGSSTVSPTDTGWGSSTVSPTDTHWGHFLTASSHASAPRSTLAHNPTSD
jgi:hypothetical protein